VLARYLENDGKGRNVYSETPSFVPFIHGKTCIELGSGAGLTGIVAAQVCSGGEKGKS
jgi:16S rRNA G527 N7-methylase RsmG